MSQARRTRVRRSRRGYHHANDICNTITSLFVRKIKDKSYKIKSAKGYAEKVEEILEDGNFWIQIQDLLNAMKRLDTQMEVY